MFTLQNDLLQSNGTILLSNYGHEHYALGFQGPRAFINRCFNLCINRGIVFPKARMSFTWFRGVKTWYLFAPSRERILVGLAAQFRSEMIMNEEVKPLVNLSTEDSEGAITTELEFDEDALAIAATQRAEAFFAGTIVHQHFMNHQEGNDDETLAPVYAFHDPAPKHRVVAAEG